MTKGNPIKLISTFMVPFLIGNLIQQFYHIVDKIFVSVFVGPEALGGVGIASTISFVMFGFAIGACNGFCIILAQRFGAKRKKGIKISVATSIYLYFIFTVFLTIFSILLTKPLLILMDTPPQNFNHAYTYAIICYCGTFSVFAYNLFSGMLRSVGDNKTPLLFLIMSASLNILLDYLAVGYLNLGTVGAAIATVASETISSISCLIFICKKYPFMWPSTKEWRLNIKYVISQIKIGVPMALEFAVTGISLIILQKGVNRFGGEIIAGFAIAMRVENLIIASFVALGTAMATFTAQNFGARKFDRIKKGSRANLIISAVLCIVFGGLLLLFWDNITELYLMNDNQAITQITKTAIKKAARQYLDIALFNFPILCLLITYRSIVQAINKTLVPLLAGFCELLMRSIGAFVLAYFFGYIGICLSPICAWYGAFFMVTAAYIINIRKLLKKTNTQYILKEKNTN